jgi:Aerobic-type carbon monoxide dehydrogenase, middle subunit CoxM/CutM homologs
MRGFGYARAGDVAEAISAGRLSDTAYLAGGTELLNWMRLGIAAPHRVLDIGRLGLDAIETLSDGSLRIGTLARLNDVAKAPAVRERFPVLSQAVLSAASAQIRNLATIGGNLLQKTRCAYFRAEEVLPCNIRLPGSGCAARDGMNECHAIFGWSDACVATQPSDPAVALAALDADVLTVHGAGERRIPINAFYVAPGTGQGGDTVLEPGELITGIEIADSAPRSVYIKVRERESYAFAIASVAISLDLDDNQRISRARIALGSVAARPWRLLAAERSLAGLCTDSAAIPAAVEESLADARPLSRNGYKITLARNLVLRALRVASEIVL